MRNAAVKSILAVMIVLEFMALPARAVDPHKYTPTLTFGGPKDPLPVPVDPESFFPVRYDFDGDLNIGNNINNYVARMIVPAGTQVNPLQRVPFDQKPTLYFRSGRDVTIRGRMYVVYQYWLYYVNNPWIPRYSHLHDWEAYFVYERNGRPEYIGLGWHKSFHLYKWSDVTSYGNHPHLHVDKGSHAMRTGRHLLGNQPIHHELIPIMVGCARQIGIDVSQIPMPAVLNRLDSPEDGVTITWDGKVMIPPHMGGGTLLQNYRIVWNMIGMAQPPRGLPPQWGTVKAPWEQDMWGDPPTSSSPRP